MISSLLAKSPQLFFMFCIGHYSFSFLFLFLVKIHVQAPNVFVKFWSLKVGRAQSAARRGTRGGSFRTAYQEEAWRRYNKRMQEEYEEELERVVSLINSPFFLL